VEKRHSNKNYQEYNTSLLVTLLSRRRESVIQSSKFASFTGWWHWDGHGVNGTHRGHERTTVSSDAGQCQNRTIIIISSSSSSSSSSIHCVSKKVHLFYFLWLIVQMLTDWLLRTSKQNRNKQEYDKLKKIIMTVPLYTHKVCNIKFTISITNT